MDLFTVFKYLKDAYKENRSSLFTRGHMEKGYKLQQERFYLDIRKKFYTVRAIIH